MLSLIFAIINNHRIEPVLERGITAEYFSDEQTQKYFQWIVDFYNKYKKVPSKEAFEKEFKISVEETYDPVEYYVDQFIYQYEIYELQKFLHQAVTQLANTKNQEQLQRLHGYIASSSFRLSEHLIRQNMFTPLEKVYERYVQKKQDILLALPWPALNRLVNGIRAGEFWVIAGRPNIGKTYILLYLLKVWFEDKCPYPILFISPEMSIDSIAQRLFAVLYRINARQLQFETDEAKAMVQAKLSEFKDVPLYIFDKISDVNQIEVYVNYYRPKLIMIDSVYLLRDGAVQSGKTALWEVIAGVLSKLRVLTTRHQLAIVATSQLSRNVGELSPVVSLNDLSYTDVFSQLADYIIGIVGSQELREQELRQLKLMKARHTSPTSLTINFKFNPFIDFSEIGSSTIMVSDNQQQNLFIDY